MADRPSEDSGKAESSVVSLKSCCFFTLYRYSPNRPIENSIANGDKNAASGDGTVADFLQKESTVNKDFSLSVVATNLTVEKESGLRNFIVKRLSRGTVYNGSGNIANMEFSNEEEDEGNEMVCYYCLLRQDNGDFVLTKQDSENVKFCSNEYVVCFLAPPNAGLDLFRQELDKYCSDLLANLEADQWLRFELDHCDQLSDLNVIVKTFLENWYDSVMEYVCRCVQKLGEDTRYLIYVALMNGRLEIEGGDEQIRTDIDRFVDCCSLSELLSQNRNKNDNGKSDESSPQSDSDSLLVEVCDIVSARGEEYRLKLQLTADKNVFDNNECSRFCEDWARALATGVIDNPVYLRQIIDNFKLKAIQEMNTLSRLLRQAETDHYALYRACVFLQSCGNAPFLLQHAKLQDQQSPDTLDVLKVIEEYLKETNHSAEST